MPQDQDDASVPKRQNPAILDVRELGVRFGGLQAVSSLDLSVRRGDLFGLIGPNGAGKSTLFNALCGAVRPTSGRIAFDGQDCSGCAPFEMARRGMARTFQLTSLFGDMTVEETMIVASHLHRRHGFIGSLLRTPSYCRELAEMRESVRSILDFAHLGAAADRDARLLTFAEQRRLEIAIALACRPKLLLLDEPAAGLSPAETSELSDLIRRINARGVTILLIEHNMRFVMRLSSRIFVLNYGEKFAEGPPEEIAANAEVRDIYLGQELSRQLDFEAGHA